MVFRRFTTSYRRSRCRAVGGALALVAALGWALPAARAEAAQGLDLALAAGTGSHRVDKLALVLGWTRPEPLWQGTTWRLRLRHEAELATWRVPGAPDVQELGYSPVLRLERPLRGGQALLFVEGSIGARLLSHTRVAPERSLSTAFQFSDMLGVGVQWGAQGRSTLGLRYQHVSNLGIKRPNPGLDFGQLYYTHRF